MQRFVFFSFFILAHYQISKKEKSTLGWNSTSHCCSIRRLFRSSIQIHHGLWQGLRLWHVLLLLWVVDCREFVDPSGARIVVDTVSLPYVKGSEVDWEDSLVRTGFVVSKNPNAAESCSCGTSFTAANANPYECIVCFMETFQKVVFLPFSRTFHTRGEEKNDLILISKCNSRAQLYCLEVKRT